jgi:hypothetical protein
MIAATYPAEPDAARLADGLAGLTGAPEQIAIIECEDDPIIFGAARAALREHYPHILNPEGCNDALLRGMSGGR